MRILLIEDDSLIGDGIKNGLEKLGFTVDWFSDGNDGHEALLQTGYDAVVLDLGLPGRDGLSILKDWRAQGYTAPVLILTARGDVDERIAGLNNGADDYLGKPFSLKEVQARLNALIRRSSGVSAPEIKYREITFNPQTRKTFLTNGKSLCPPKKRLFWNFFCLTATKSCPKKPLKIKFIPGTTTFPATPWKSTFTICAKNSAKTSSKRSIKSAILWRIE